MFSDSNARRSHRKPGYFTIRFFLFRGLKIQLEQIK
jgi:hypothetical protein